MSYVLKIVPKFDDGVFNKQIGRIKNSFKKLSIDVSSNLGKSLKKGAGKAATGGVLALVAGLVSSVQKVKELATEFERIQGEADFFSTTAGQIKSTAGEVALLSKAFQALGVDTEAQGRIFTNISKQQEKGGLLEPLKGKSITDIVAILQNNFKLAQEQGNVELQNKILDIFGRGGKGAEIVQGNILKDTTTISKNAGFKDTTSAISTLNKGSNSLSSEEERLAFARAGTDVQKLATAGKNAKTITSGIISGEQKQADSLTKSFAEAAPLFAASLAQEEGFKIIQDSLVKITSKLTKFTQDFDKSFKLSSLFKF
jgi:hypothetical protein